MTALCSDRKPQLGFLLMRPQGFLHEGFWRLIQVFRLGSAAVFFAFSVMAFIFGGDLAPVFGIAAIACLIGLILAFRLLMWVIRGFKPQHSH